MTGATKSPRVDDGPEHPDEAGDGMFFRLKFCNDKSVKRAGVDPWMVIPVVVAHNLRDGDGDHRNKHPSDPARHHLNEILTGPARAKQVVELAHDTLRSLDRPPARHDAVMCWEALIKPPSGWDTPEFWALAMEFIETDEASTGMLKLSVPVHRDQESVHAHAVLLPVRDGAMVSRENVNPMAMRERFFRFMRERLGIRVDTPKKRREQRQDKRAKTLGDLAATTGAGPKTAAGARARDDALASLIGRASGDLMRVGVPPFGLADVGVSWALPRVRGTGGIQVGGIQVQGHGAGVFGGGIQVGGIHVEWVGGATCMPLTTTCAVSSPSSATRKSVPFRWLESVSASRVSEGAAAGCEGLAKPPMVASHTFDPDTGELLPIEGKATGTDTSASESTGHDVSRRLVRKGKAMVEADCPNVAWRHSANEAATQLARAPRLAGPNGDIWRVGFAAIDAETGRARQAGLNVDNARARTRATFERAERARADGKTVDINALAARFGVPGVDGCIHAPAEAQAMAAGAPQTLKVSKATRMSQMRRQRSLAARLAASAKTSQLAA